MREVLFETGTYRPRMQHACRVGRPRANWLLETMADAFHTLDALTPFDIHNMGQINQLVQKARERSPPFSNRGWPSHNTLASSNLSPNLSANMAATGCLFRAHLVFLLFTICSWRWSSFGFSELASKRELQIGSIGPAGLRTAPRRSCVCERERCLWQCNCPWRAALNVSSLAWRARARV